MLHMVLQVNLPDGAFLADVGFGNLAPTAPLQLCADVEQATPHEVMRFIWMGDELTLQSRLGRQWEHIYRVVLLPRVDVEYQICNWFTATHPKSPHRSNLIAARPGANRTRITLYNAGLSVRHADGEVERRMLTGKADYREVLEGTFGLSLSDEDLDLALETVARKGTQGAPHPSFA
jgi:N-hydroxyarylamine O-acetyltransferase